MSAAGNFKSRVQAAIADQRLVRAVRLTALRKVDQRAVGMAQLHDAEGLRTLAAAIKQHTLDHLPRYLAQFVEQVERRGGHVHFAPDAEAARRLIVDLARRYGLQRAVKAKSMATEEVHLNAALEAAGVQVVETDLGEYIVQIDHDRPSHIVTPIIHKDRRQIAQAMQRELGCEYTEDATALTLIARRHLREVFRRCDLGITGVNFGIAETGSLCLVTNEGNGRLTITRPRVHVALMGIEKLLPRLSDLPVYLKLLSRSTTGQAMGVYTTLITGPRRPDDLDGPEALHVVLLDNGRQGIWDSEFRAVLRCVRCGACLNACPVYRNVGGHAYNSVYPGPIGSLVTPLLGGLAAHADLPRASSLCGACEVACPVKIDIPGFLVKLRARTADTQPLAKRVGFRLWRAAMHVPMLYRTGQRLLRWFVRLTGKDGWTRRGAGPLAGWTACRDLPAPAPDSFRRRWQKGLRDER
jgi:L-lactate dehydrogenase complex protein LldF